MNNHHVAVLLAAYNGELWIQEQIFSILSQKHVSVSIFISLDKSTDNTELIIERIAAEHENVHLLPYGQKFGGAAKNFYRLISDVNFLNFNFISLADQDDIWFEDKLSRAINKLETNKYNAYSSNVIAFWPDGRKQLIDKAQPQVQFDFLFEAAGPGCTYVLTKQLALALKAKINASRSEIDEIILHDWFIYAYARANEYRWYIDDEPSMSYRQHSSNQVGANVSITSALKRLSMIRTHWYRNQIIQISNSVGFGSHPFLIDTIHGGRCGMFKIAANCHKVRRRQRDKIAFFLAAIFGLI